MLTKLTLEIISQYMSGKSLCSTPYAVLCVSYSSAKLGKDSGERLFATLKRNSLALSLTLNL